MITKFLNFQFVGDILIFYGANRKRVTKLKFILYSFKLLSGLKTNIDKSSVLGLGISQSERNQIASILGSKTAEFPLSYLGMPLHYKRLKMNDWTPLLKKISKKLIGRKGKLLSIAGRIMLVNAIITPTIIYWMSCFILRSTIIRKINRLCWACLWRNGERNLVGRCLLNWTTVCHLREFRGMGIINLRILNQTIFCKWW